MNFATIQEVKSQLRLDTDDTSEDELLQLYLDASIELIETYLNRNVYTDEVPEGDKLGLIFTKKMKIAQLLIVGDWYKNRENSQEKSLVNIPLGVKELLLPNRKVNI